ncbi:hypothetical protein [Novipirellula caenicola]|uniref:YtkA-like domain-containing protein n=1 Tax=Novipirellula caenicola TaxID=1536901 RepID=A0ABP9VTN2_9BACT
MRHLLDFSLCVFASLLLVCSGCQKSEPALDGSGIVIESVTATPASFPNEVTSNGEAYVLSELDVLEEHIVINKPFSFSFILEEKSGRFPVDDEFTVNCEAVMPAHNHGMNYEPEIAILKGGMVTVKGMVFHMPGEWQVHVDVTANAVTERSQWAINL